MAKQRRRNPSMEDEAIITSLQEILACLRAQNLSYQTSHWQAKGKSFYQDHLLFERLYNSVLPEIDQLAEKIAGMLGSEEVGLNRQNKAISSYLDSWSKIPDPIERGLASEKELQVHLAETREFMEEKGRLSLGMDDYLAATASNHDTNIYLLQQARSTQSNPKKRGLKMARRRNPDNFKQEIVEKLHMLKKNYFHSGWECSLEDISDEAPNQTFKLYMNCEELVPHYPGARLRNIRLVVNYYAPGDDFVFPDGAVIVEARSFSTLTHGYPYEEVLKGKDVTPIAVYRLLRSHVQNALLPLKEQDPNTKTWRNNPSSSSLGAIAMAGLAGYFLGKK